MFGVSDGVLMFRPSVAAFYPRLMYFFYSLCGPAFWNRILAFVLLHCIYSEIEKIVYWMPEILFAAEIAFCGLDRCMPQQKLNLLQFTATVVAQLRTGSP